MSLISTFLSLEMHIFLRLLETYPQINKVHFNRKVNNLLKILKWFGKGHVLLTAIHWNSPILLSNGDTLEL